MANFQNLKLVMDNIGLAKLPDVINELLAVEDDVECPYCANWFTTKARLDEEVETTCPTCHKLLSISVVQYLVASDFME